MFKSHYCMYLRKSREDLELEKYNLEDTLSRHKKILEEYAEKNKIEIEQIYQEVVSGETIAERKEMQKLLADVENNKWTGVLVVEVERLARGDTTDQGIIAKAFKYSKTKIITPVKTYDPTNEFDEEFFEYGLFMSRREYKTINRRLQRGREISVSEGKYIGSIAPYGYKRKKLVNAKGYTLEVDEKEAVVVKEIFELYAYKLESINSVANTINMLGIKPRKSEKWTTSSIKEILSNPVYIGKIRWNARKEVKKTKNGVIYKTRPRNKENIIIVEGIHTPIIDMSIWNVVQNKRKNIISPISQEKELKNPLSGLIYCGKCNRLMQRRPYKDGSKPTIICNNQDCDNISSKLSIVEDKIIEAMKVWLKNYKIDYRKINKEKRENNTYIEKNILNNLKLELSKQEAKKEHIYNLLEEGIYTKKEYTVRIKKCKDKIRNLQIEINKLKKTFNQEITAEDEKKENMPKFENILDLYSKLESAKDKNELLQSIIKKITYVKTVKSIKKDSNPSEFEIHIYPRIKRI